MKKLLITFVVMMSYLNVLADNSNAKFLAKNEQGYQMEFTILSEKDKTVSMSSAKGDAKDEKDKIIIPEKVTYNGIEYTVTEIGERAFEWKNKRYKAATVVLPPTIKRINNAAFLRNLDLQHINLPEGLVSIGDEAFEWCDKLQPVKFPTSLVDIGKGAFITWKKVRIFKSLDIPNSVRVIGEMAFGQMNMWGALQPPVDYEIINIPPIVDETNCEKMGISRRSVTEYLAAHPRNYQQQGVYYAQGQQPVVAKPKVPSSDVDVNIPEQQIDNGDMFVVIIGNEKYRNVAEVSYAENDAKIFKEYCMKTLGVPERQIKYCENATFNDIRTAVNWLKELLQTCSGKGNAIFYYAGHGIPDERNKASYLLPVDGNGNDVGSAYGLAQLYEMLGSVSARSVVVLLDACFSGAKRGGDMIVAARGVAITPKQETPRGKMIVFSATRGDESAYAYEKKQHGMFTYFLLKKLREAKGHMTLGELSTYMTEQVSRNSILENSKKQTPTVVVSPALTTTWKNMKLVK